MPLENVDQDIMINFIQSHILCMFGIPKTITKNQGLIFTGQNMVEFASELGIKLLTSTPYYT